MPENHLPPRLLPYLFPSLPVSAVLAFSLASSRGVDLGLGFRRLPSFPRRGERV